jgi:D-sedoheptulose 7-phosphate isomerase
MTDFLYPFIEADERDAGPLLVDLAASAEAKAIASDALRERTLADQAGVIVAAARAVRERFDAGGRLLVFGNGGSSTDAGLMASLFSHPPAGGRPRAARSLADDHAVITALGNDVGFDLVFARQLMAEGRAADIACALSTSGSSRNLLVAMETARDIGMLTVAITGYDGGQLATSDAVDHCLIVRSDSVHRIQEVQGMLVLALWEAVDG